MSRRFRDLLREFPSEDMQKIVYKTKLEFLKEGDLIPDGTYLQNKGDLIVTQSYENKKKVKAKSGLFNIRYMPNDGLNLEPTSFLKDSFLHKFDPSNGIIQKINNFFNSIHKYQKHNIFPKRGFLLYGPPGCSKSATISVICDFFQKDNSTFIINWKTFKYRSNDVFDLLKRLEYDKNIKKMIFIMEDIGGGSVEYSSNRSVDSTLLSILDNVDQIYKVPTAIIATTNYPQNLLDSLTDRPSRFDDLIKFDKPSAEMRSEFLKFFAKDKVTNEDINEIMLNKYSIFSIAHIKEVFIRSELNDLTLKQSMEEVFNQSNRVAASFEDKKKKGVGFDLDDY